MTREFSGYDKLWNALAGRPEGTAIDDKIQEGLSETEAAILETRFGLTGSRPTSLQDTGTAIGATGDDVRRIEALALRKLRLELAVQRR